MTAKKTSKPAAKKATAAKPTPKKAAAKNPIGAKATEAKLATEAPAKAAAAVAPVNIPATDELQAICDERTEIVGEIATAKGTVNEATTRLHAKNAELLAAGAVPGMVFRVGEDEMQFTHHVKPSKSLKDVIAEFLENHEEFAEEFAELEIKHTKENQQQPNFKGL